MAGSVGIGDAEISPTADSESACYPCVPNENFAGAAVLPAAIGRKSECSFATKLNAQNPWSPTPRCLLTEDKPQMLTLLATRIFVRGKQQEK